MKPIKGMAVASMVASLFATGCGAGTENTQQNVDNSQQAVVKCAGINSCAGQGACAGSVGDAGAHDCAGKNSCAGQGWIEVPRSECDTKGGTVIQ